MSCDGELQVIERSPKFRLQKALWEMIFEHHNTCCAILLKPELVLAADHPFAHFSTDLGGLDLEITLATELRSNGCECYVFGSPYIFRSADNATLTERTAVELHEIQMVRVRMWTCRNDLCDDYFFLTSYLLDSIDFGGMDRIEMPKFFYSELGESRRNIGVERYPGKRDFHSENEMKKTKKQYFPMDYMEDTVFFKREWKKLWHREYASTGIERFFIGRGDGWEYDVTGADLGDKIRGI